MKLGEMVSFSKLGLLSLRLTKILDLISNKYIGVSLFREAFQPKKRRNLGNGPNRGGESSKNQKNPKFQLGIVQNYGGVFRNQKSPKFQRVSKTKK